MIYLLICIILGLTACSSPPKTANEYWFGQGYRLGSQGYAYENSKFEQFKKDTLFSDAAYQEGYEKGIEEFCAPHLAFTKGIQGIRYKNQCAGHPQEVLIRAEWTRGWQAFMGQDLFR